MSETRTIVTSENLAAFNEANIGLVNPEVKVPVDKVEEPAKTEEKVEEKEEKVDEPEKKEETPEEPVKTEDKEEIEGEKKEPEKKKNNKLEKRFSEITQKRDDALNEARRERELREAAQRELNELKNQLNPKKVEEDTKPNPKDFTDAFEYAEKLADWSAKKAAQEAISKKEKDDFERRQKDLREQSIKSWEEKISSTTQEIEDYADIVGTSELAVSDEVRDAIIDSDMGPKILYHLANNPDVVDKINKMNVLGALREIGKIEAKYEEGATTVAKKTESKEAVVEIKEAASISKAPPPIVPLKTKSVSSDNLIASNGEFKGDYQQWKELRRAGKIK